MATVSASPAGNQTRSPIITTHKPVILAVDDAPANLKLIKVALAAHYHVITASNGNEALQLLREEAAGIEVVLLDLMMPVIDGMETLRQIKADPRLKLIPVALQTAAGDAKNIAEGLKAGCFYYLTKPLDLGLLREVVATAVRDHNQLKELHSNLDGMKSAILKMNEAEFHFQSRREANLISALLANASSMPDILGMGLMELMVNAVEHGNLGISYDEKTALLKENRLEEEIERRLNVPEYAGKLASVKFRRQENKLEFIVTDQGNGFDWSKYLEMDPARMMDNHGRGIAMARSLTFGSIEYRGCGNIVVSTFIETKRP